MAVVGDPRLIAPYFSWKKFSVAVPASSRAKVLNNSRSRVAIAFGPVAAGGLFVGPFSDVDAFTGWSTGTASGINLTFVYRDWGALLGSEWFANNTTAGPSTLRGFEVLFRPPPRLRRAFRGAD